MGEIDEYSGNEILILDGRSKLQDYRDYWFEVQKKSFSNTITFWGVLIISPLIFAFLNRNSINTFVILLAVSGILTIIPVLMYVFSYQSFMAIGRRYLKSLTEEEKYFTMTFNIENDGFECINGRNYSYIAWSSIDGATETAKQFVLVRQINSILLTKDLFKSQSQINFFRFLLKNKLENKVKLLD